MNETDSLNDGQESEELITPSYYEGLTHKQRRFVEEYCKDFNATQAAIRAGYSSHTAAEIGRQNLRKLEISSAVSQFMSECSMSAEEAIKSISDIARTRLNDYMVVRHVQGRELTEQYVTVLISQAKEQIEVIRQFMKDEGIEKKGGLQFKRQIAQLQRQILDYQHDINRYGNDVTRLAPGRPIVVEQVDLDLVALAKDKERGRIKTYKPTEHGIQVEMYAADANLEKILRYHGKITDPPPREGGNVNVDNRTWNIINHAAGHSVPAPDDDYSA